MRATAKEHWKSLLPRILSHAEIEVPHNFRLSELVLEAKDSTEGA